MKARQSLNAATGYSLRRIKLKSNLFYPSTAEAQIVTMAAAPNEKKKTPIQEEDYDELPLPSPKLSFLPSSLHSYRNLNFLPFYNDTRGGGGEGNFLSVDEFGHAALHDADACTVGVVPGMGVPCRYHPVSCSVTHAHAADPARPHALYVMDREGGSFQALVYGDPRSPWDRTPISPSGRLFSRDHDYAWHWRPLPTPRVEDINKDDDAGCSFSDDDVDSSYAAQCYALLHGQEDAGDTTCISFSPRDPDADRYGGLIGTYCFDTASHQWSKAGDWMLPFCSRAHHVPELDDGLLFGLEHEKPNRFCSTDISGIKMNRAPILRHAWLEHAEPPPEWTLTKNNLVYLGAGRFCIHRSFSIMVQCGYGDWEIQDTVVLLTGVEVVRAPGSPKLRMVKHKSKRLDRDIESLL